MKHYTIEHDRATLNEFSYKVLGAKLAARWSMKSLKAKPEG